MKCSAVFIKMWQLIWTLMFGFLEWTLAQQGELADYCVTESFEAKCQSNEVIMMQEATYGRMRLGRCVKTDFGYLGCQEDVLDVADRKCSGRRTCSIAIPEPMLEEKSSCNQEFKSYLETKYICVEVVNTSGRRCQGNEEMKIRQPSGLLANSVTETTGCGSDTTPWKIEANPGQKINFTLYDFMWTHKDITYSSTDVCPLYAVITETATGQKFNVCGRRGRERHVYMTLTNSVEVRMLRQYKKEEMDKGYFLLQFDVIGCSDPVLPGNTWLQREGSEATIGCDHDDRTWKLHCHGSQWKGVMGNCSGVHTSSSTAAAHSRLLSLPMDVAIVIIAGVAFVIGAIIFVIGLYIIRSRRYFTGGHSQPRTIIYQEADKNNGNDLTEEEWKLAYQLQSSTKPPHSLYMQTSDTGSANENEYAYVWDTVPSPANPTNSCIQSPEGGSGDRRFIIHSPEGPTDDRRFQFRGPGPFVGPDQRNTNAHDGQYERRIAPQPKSGLETVYEKGTGQRYPAQYFELDQLAAQKGNKL